jgi:hypothetical protein
MTSASFRSSNCGAQGAILQRTNHLLILLDKTYVSVVILFVFLTYQPRQSHKPRPLYLRHRDENCYKPSSGQALLTYPFYFKALTNAQFANRLFSNRCKLPGGVGVHNYVGSEVLLELCGQVADSKALAPHVQSKGSTFRLGGCQRDATVEA